VKPADRASWTGRHDFTWQCTRAIFKQAVNTVKVLAVFNIALINLISFAADVLGKVYGVISKRRGRIIAEDLKDGTSFWQISSRMPVVESFGFSDGKNAGRRQLPLDYQATISDNND
jgi:hypothetical protein